MGAFAATAVAAATVYAYVPPPPPPPLLLQVGSEPIDVAAFEEAAGVGVEVGPEQVKEAVAACVRENEEKLREER